MTTTHVAHHDLTRWLDEWGIGTPDWPAGLPKPARLAVPEALVARAIEGWVEHLIPDTVLGDLFGAPPQQVVARLAAAGITQTRQDPQWADVADLPTVNLDLSELDDDSTGTTVLPVPAKVMLQAGPVLVVTGTGSEYLVDVPAKTLTRVAVGGRSAKLRVDGIARTLIQVEPFEVGDKMRAWLEDSSGEDTFAMLTTSVVTTITPAVPGATRSRGTFS